MLRIVRGTTPDYIEVDEEVVNEVKKFIRSLLPKGFIYGNLDLKLENMANELKRTGATSIKLPTGVLRFKIVRRSEDADF